MQRIIARRMGESKATVPHFYLTAEVDMTKAIALRKDFNAALEAEGIKVSVNDLIVRASGLALRDNRQFHRSWVDGRRRLVEALPPLSQRVLLRTRHRATLA